MPKCLNDHTRNYKGNEPSPKGYGYCAHVEPTGIIRIGTDGNAWICNENSKKVKRWVIQAKDIFKPLRLINFDIKINDIRISHLRKSQQNHFLQFMNNQDLINDLKILGVSLFIIEFSDYKLVDQNDISKQQLYMNQGRDQSDWDEDDLKYQQITEKHLPNSNDPYLLAVLEYDSIKKQYLDKTKPIIYFNSNIGYKDSFNLKNKKKNKEQEEIFHYSLVEPIQAIFQKYFGSRYHWNGKYFNIPYIDI